MLIVPILLAVQAIALVPGGCTAPAAENVGKSGCYLSGELAIASPPATLYWHIAEFPDEAAALAAAKRHLLTKVVHAHGRWWLYVLSDQRDLRLAGKMRGVVGPFNLPAGRPVTARFLESTFPPGMRTRVHSHPGPEAFFVIEGEQCVDTPAGHATIHAWESRIVEGGAHVQAARKGRRSLVLILARAGEPWMTPETGWVPSDYCF